MTAPQEKAIREALEAGPTPGPWTASNRGSYAVDSEDEGSVYGPEGEDVGAEFVKPIGNAPTIRGELWYRDAAFVAACNPEAMTALLAQLAELRAEVERLRLTADQRTDLFAAALYISAHDDETAVLSSENADRIADLLCDLSGFDINNALAAGRN